jgi:CxxC motif-containing protein (DUF1111 family)
MKFGFCVIFLLLLQACERLQPDIPEENSVLDGPVAGLNHAENILHLRGDVAFNDKNFHASNGLGPIFVATRCGSCHAGDGKGHPFSTLTRFGQSDSSGNLWLHQGGPQLQNRALPGFLPEQIPAGAPSARFMPPAVTGLGFLEAISEKTLIGLSDPNDLNQDGISGVPHWNQIPDYVKPFPGSFAHNGRYITRFGLKASVYDLFQQTARAYNQDMGITSLVESLDPFSGLQAEPEVSMNEIRDVVFYLQTLKAPLPRNSDDAEVKLGRELFLKINCAGCHIPELQTGYSSINALSYKTIHPYTDLLLHDMGPELDDGYTEGYAKSSEWRTAPLWGLGLAPASQGGRYFLLHDGRASSPDEAIRLHGGEADASRQKYLQLQESERKAVIKFLESL